MSVDSDTLIYNINQEEDTQIDYRNANYKKIHFKFEDFSKEIVINQDFHLGKGGIFWDGSFITSHLLLNKYILPNQLEKKVFLELGSGTSLPSMVAAMGSSVESLVIMSDISKTFHFREGIVGLNKEKFNCKVLNLNLDVEKEDERKGLDLVLDENGIQRIDYIICSELIYIDEIFDSLIETISHYSKRGNESNDKSSQTKTIITYRERLPEQVKCFFDRFDLCFNRVEVNCDMLKKFEMKKRMFVFEASLK